jgi:hypothetical protein
MGSSERRPETQTVTESPYGACGMLRCVEVSLRIRLGLPISIGCTYGLAPIVPSEIPSKDDAIEGNVLEICRCAGNLDLRYGKPAGARPASKLCRLLGPHAQFKFG